nr:unnamed protein product [Callosobruchus analis]
MLALRRFVSRRGKPRRVYSDNGTNFVSTAKELKDLGNYIKQNQGDLEAAFSKENIEWKFIPPRSPHFGGLWEAGIKSMKFHLTRVAGNVHFTYEFFYTLLTEVEAILNSRPISPLSSNPHDLNPLTPAHFLLEQQSNCLREVDVRTIPTNRLTVYRHLQQIKQHIWQRWCKEYVSELQQRTKWQRTQGRLQQGALVLIKEDNVPPMNWKLGRVVNLHQGKDGVNRVC